MCNKILSTFCLLLLSIFILNAQEQDITKIKQLYNDAQENIAYQKNGDIPEDNIHLVINQNMPALGPQTYDYNFYFTLDYSEEEPGEYFHTLCFVNRSFNFAQSAFYYEEFLYDKNGDLVFYFLRMKAAFCFELRCYFKDENLIKILIKEVNSDGDCENSNDYVITHQSVNEVPYNYEEYVNSIKPASEKIKNIFKTIDK